MSHAAVGSRGAGYGLDAELARKQAEKYDLAAETQVKEWITAVTGDPFGPSFGDSLKDGRILCNLINRIRPGTVKKVESSSMPFKQMENISNFLKGCRTLGIPEHDLFETVDLYEQKDMGVVVICLCTLGRMSKSTSGFAGPYLAGPGQPASLGDVHSSVAVAAAVVPVAVSAPKPAPPPPAPPARPVAATTTTVFKAPAAAAAPVAVAEVQNSGRTNTNHGPVYGLDAELKKKMQLQYDPNLEAEAVQWITAVTGKMKPAGEELGAWLHDGTILCELVNTIRPGIIKKINKSSMPFMQMENITAFLRCCRSSLSVPEADLFETVDLYEEKNMNFVIRCLFSLGRSIQTLTPPYTGPALVTHR